jgi:hypothetical protein
MNAADDGTRTRGLCVTTTGPQALQDNLQDARGLPNAAQYQIVGWAFLGKTALNATLFSSLFRFMNFRSSARRRFPLQFDLIVINGGTDEIF